MAHAQQQVFGGGGSDDAENNDAPQQGSGTQQVNVTGTDDL